MKISRNFSKQEFNCNDGTPVPIHLYSNLTKLVKNLQVIRDYVQAPIHINSAYRSEDYNFKIGGATKSQHLLAKASDITVEGWTPLEVYDMLEFLIDEGLLHNGGIGVYKTFIHYDVRDYPARWKDY